MDVFKLWLGYIAAEVIDKCISLNLQSCPACKNGVLSPILHFHNHLNLKEIIETYFDGASNNMDVNSLLQKFANKLNVLDISNGGELIMIGQTFVRTLTAKALYYGDYITAENDKIVSDVLNSAALNADIPHPTEYNPASPSYEPAPIKRKIPKKNNKTSIRSVTSHEDS